jgi:membrane protease YdiL (CAAX protease family)
LFGFYAVNIVASMLIILGGLSLTGALAELFSAAAQSPEAYSDAYDTIMENAPLGLASIVGIILGSFMLLIPRGIRLFTEDLTKMNEPAKVSRLFMMLGLILGVNAVVSFLSVLFALAQEALGFSGGGDALDVISYLVNPLGLLYVVILGPLFEEIIFRGAILRTLLPFGQNFAIVVSALLFGLYHLILTQGIFAFFVGLVLAYCTLRYSIKWAMLLHMVNNGLAMLLSFWAPGFGVELGIYGLYLVFGILALIFGLKLIREQMRTGKPRSISAVYGLPTASSGYTQTPPQGQPVAYGQPAYAAQPWPAPQQIEPKARPWAITFTSPILLVGLVIAGLISIMMVL